ncbi:aminopeptidase [Atopobacter sp. AH10]|uniref:aminopeptidase C n=1 Tax=Atopobacter sp. AH10 TaxID=2315861 RepID=UPI000EF20523|nr:C1 family peptidase [Atopobacter sp. AH10]RLK62482.1 aminopeptidase [Atopobacter sp. AH10]
MSEITTELLKKYQADYDQSTGPKILSHAIAKQGYLDSIEDNSVLRRHDFVFSDETKRGEITNQKRSGRCWMFAALNTARVDTMKELNLESFEFSQNYTLFWDKLEKANYFLESIIKTVDEDLTSRLVMHLLKDPLQDGGQWDMFSGILKKYGVVPKKVMPETYHSSNTAVLDSLLTKKVREIAKDIRNKHAEGASEDELRTFKEERLSVIYTMLTEALGQVPTRFSYSYRDKDKKHHTIKDITPQEFFAKYVGWDLDQRISLINAPTADKPYGRAYTVKYLGTVHEAEPIHYINVPIEVLKEAAINSIKAGEPVWFGCDVGQISNRQIGVMDKDLFDYEAAIGEPFNLNKAERLDYGESLLTHAMVFVGVDLDENGKPIKWKVENSWGDEPGDKGIFSMSDAWFDEFNYQIMVDKSYVPAEWLKALEQPLVELEPWDPFGALAVY